MRHEKPPIRLRYSITKVASDEGWSIFDNVKMRWAERDLDWDEAHSMAEYLESLDGDDEPDEYAGTRLDRAASRADDEIKRRAENDNGT